MKYLIYAMEGEEMCFLHALMNAKQLKENGYEVKMILEGASVKLPDVLHANGNPLFKKLVEDGTIVGVCEACAKSLGVYERNQELGMNFISDMNGHAGVLDYVKDGYEVMVF